MALSFSADSLAGEERVLRIYPLGDSITRGIEDAGYRLPLFQLLKRNGTKFHFVGSLSSGPQSFPEKAHDGHNGWVISQIKNEIAAWTATFKPDLILLMIGSNDIEGSLDVHGMPARMLDLLLAIRRARPSARIFVSEVSLIRIPRFDAQAVAFNVLLKQIVYRFRQRGEPVYFVPMHDVLQLDEIDSVDHPNAQGNWKMAERWLQFISPYLASRDR